MTDNVVEQTSRQLKSSDDTISKDHACGEGMKNTSSVERKLNHSTNDVDVSSTDSSIHAKKKHHRKRDSSKNDRHRDRQSGDKESKSRNRDRHDKKKKRYREESDSLADSDSGSDHAEHTRRRKHDKKKSKKERKHSHRRRHEESNEEKGIKKGTAIRRSVITGEKIQLKIDKTSEDVIQEQARKQLLDFMNASYK